MEPEVDKVYSVERDVMFSGSPDETVAWLKAEFRPGISDIWVAADHDWMSLVDYLNWRNLQQVKHIIRGVMFRQASTILLDEPMGDPQEFIEQVAEKIAKLYR